MKRYILIVILFIGALSSYALTCGNSLIILAPKDNINKYTIYVSEKKMCSNCFSKKTRFELNSIYAETVTVKIVSGDISSVHTLKLSPSKNDFQEPFNAIYVIERKKNKIKLKLKSLEGKTKESVSIPFQGSTK